MQDLVRRVERGEALSLDAIHAAAHPFVAALLHKLFPTRTILVITGGVKTQENFHQDLTTWVQHIEKERPPLFFASWDILPHESKLPHADVISERLETLVALATQREAAETPGHVIVTNMVALMQKTFPPGDIAKRTRTVSRGDQINPLDLIEWLEDQGYEPEAQVNHKGEIALRGGILDIFPPTSPWPMRIEFFGDEIDSIREFDPISQISREQTDAVTIPPAGELGILKKQAGSEPAISFATLLDHLPSDAVIVLSEPESLDSCAADYTAQITAGDAFFTPWNEVQRRATDEFTSVAIFESAAEDESSELPPLSEHETTREDEVALTLKSLDAFRPIAERAVDLQIAEAQRREFFAQLHRWLRQGYAVHVFCNTQGERQRFEEIWNELGFEKQFSPSTHLGTLSRGFMDEPSKLVVVTDAEIFGRYKVQRPRRLKSPHAAASRSALDIDFTEFEEGDYVVHVQHGIGRFLGLQIFDQGAGRKPTERSKRTTGQECLAIEYASSDPAQPAPKLYVPVSEAHLV
ncbi:MAG TPA: CarD family transcriptional regulator, partial [Candidatus Acidoferrum sp.]|nr:CarD family transcriptional regulator [Candidatus Acidoferrum sp.]